MCIRDRSGSGHDTGSETGAFQRETGVVPRGTRYGRAGGVSTRAGPKIPTSIKYEKPLKKHILRAVLGPFAGPVLIQCAGCIERTPDDGRHRRYFQ